MDSHLKQIYSINVEANEWFKVLRTFKVLHRTRTTIFKDDSYALEAARQRINSEYKKNKLIKDTQSVSEMIELAKSVERELRTTVVQAKKVSNDKYELRLTPETTKLDNTPYKESGT